MLQAKEFVKALANKGERQYAFPVKKLKTYYIQIGVRVMVM